MNLIQYISISTFCVALTGCASFSDSSQQKVNFDSESPLGVHVAVNGIIIGATPVSYVINGEQTNVLSFSKPGYRLRKMLIQPGKQLSNIDAQLFRDERVPAPAPNAVDPVVIPPIKLSQEQEIKFDSMGAPAEVLVMINGKVVGKTPLTCLVDSKTAYTVTFTKSGYQPRQQILAPNATNGHAPTIDARLGMPGAPIAAIPPPPAPAPKPVATPIPATEDLPEIDNVPEETPPPAPAPAPVTKKPEILAPALLPAQVPQKTQPSNRVYIELKAALDELQMQRKLNIISQEAFEKESALIEAEIDALYSKQ